eukprot:5412617-Lingulodinium_polyedra.AAC.1
MDWYCRPQSVWDQPAARRGHAETREARDIHVRFLTQRSQATTNRQTHIQTWGLRARSHANARRRV